MLKRAKILDYRFFIVRHIINNAILNASAIVSGLIHFAEKANIIVHIITFCIWHLNTK